MILYIPRTIRTKNQLYIKNTQEYGSRLFRYRNTQQILAYSRGINN